MIIDIILFVLLLILLVVFKLLFEARHMNNWLKIKNMSDKAKSELMEYESGQCTVCNAPANELCVCKLGSTGEFKF